jgi:hypothetical protein
MADPQAALRQWIVDGLQRKGHGSGRELARRIGIEPQVLSRMKNTDGLKETRRIEAHMIPAIAEYFGTIPPGFENVADLRCAACERSAIYDNGGKASGEREMSDTKKVTINIQSPKQGTLVIGDNNTVSTTNTLSLTGEEISADDMMRLDDQVAAISDGRKIDKSEVWRELCSAISIPDPALITNEVLPAVEKILAKWKGDVIREAVDNKGG